MKCYFCLNASPSMTNFACALCQRCGAAICERHTVSLLAPAGMAGGRRYTLACSQCSAAPSAHGEYSQPGACKQDSSQREGFVWLFWFAHKKRAERFPAPSTVVAAVEQFLKERREH